MPDNEHTIEDVNDALDRFAERLEAGHGRGALSQEHDRKRAILNYLLDSNDALDKES